MEWNGKPVKLHFNRHSKAFDDVNNKPKKKKKKNINARAHKEVVKGFEMTKGLKTIQTGRTD